MRSDDMRWGIRLWLAALALALPAGAAVVATAQARDDDARYALVDGCFTLRSVALDRPVAKDGDGGYRAAPEPAGDAERFRMQATGLGRYLLYGSAADVLAGEGNRARSATQLTDAADFRVDGGPRSFTITLPSAGKALAVDGDSGRLVLADARSAGDRARFAFEDAEGCAVFPEAQVNATGEPSKGPTPYGEVRGLLDAHLHMMAFEFLGGRARCGRPWHRFGITKALVDCADHGPMGAGAVLENIVSCGGSCPTHDTDGWPTFEGWPKHRSLTHEQVYYKWMERAWRGGLRMFVNLLVDNSVLCEVYPYKRNSCNEMDGVRLQAARIHELEDYIDAQEGGPGKGWFRIVDNPFEARRVMNQGKLAVVLGIEVSKLFDCGEYNGKPDPGCDRASIDRMLDEVHDMGVRQMELVNKSDNALAGVAGDGGATGVLTNNANRYDTGHYWDMRTCDEQLHAETHDREQITVPGGVADRDALAGGVFQQFVPRGATPLYSDAPHCNAAGLTGLGEHAIRGMMRRGMIFDPDHMSVRARDEAINVLESEDYSGIISSHTWSTPETYPRIYRLGGMITPYAGNATRFVKEWRRTKALADDDFLFGLGYGADTNGFGGQGAPRRGPDPVRYPFRSFDGAVTLDRQVSGTQTYDINTDGVAHYGLYPDWIEDLRQLAGDEIIEDMARGPEAYLQMWERAQGVRAERCRSPRSAFPRQGIGQIRLHRTPRRLLGEGGQPGSREGRVWRYCVDGRGNSRRHVAAVFTSRERVGLVGSTAPGHEAGGVGPGDSAASLRARGARPFGSGVLVRDAGRAAKHVYRVRHGRVRSVAVAARSVASSRSRLRGYLRRAGL